jgi:hypothetical protein
MMNGRASRWLSEDGNVKRRPNRAHIFLADPFFLADICGIVKAVEVVEAATELYRPIGGGKK